MPPELAGPFAEVIGDPVAHSKSPLIHRHWLREIGIRGDYLATAVKSDALSSFLSERRSEQRWRGCNITIPHKETVLPLLDRLDERAALIGAVNCAVTRDGKLVGYNTDVDGIAAALDEVTLEGRKAAIIGAGGAARAALAYLANRGISEAVALARDPGKVRSLEEILPGKLAAGPINDAATLLQGSALIINASPLGMAGCPDMPPKLLEAVRAQRNATLFDMVYAPLRTKFLSAGQNRTVNGLTMLVGQAATAFELFFGHQPPATTQDVTELLIASGSQAEL